MGGKDGIVVDADLRLDPGAAAGVVASAFGYQGQKCFSLLTAIVVERVYDAFLEKLAARVAALGGGFAGDPKFDMGPVINDSARKKHPEVHRYGKKEAV